jgi:hypothetical protein
MTAPDSNPMAAARHERELTCGRNTGLGKANDPLIPTFAKVPAAMGCKC